MSCDTSHSCGKSDRLTVAGAGQSIPQGWLAFSGQRCRAGTYRFVLKLLHDSPSRVLSPGSLVLRLDLAFG